MTNHSQPNKDQLRRFVFANADVRGELVQLDQTIHDAMANHDYPEPIQLHLAELMTACALLAAVIKFNGRMFIQAKGENGPVSVMQVECDNQFNLRGIARWEGDIDPAPQTLQQLLGDNGRLAIIIIPDQGEQYQGIVPLTGERVEHCIEEYFAQSEQLNTRLWLFPGDQRCSGLLLQELPNQDAEKLEQDWAHLEHLTQTLTPEEMLELDQETLLHRLYHQEQYKLYPPHNVQFKCTCSRDRTAEALISLGEQELFEMLEEGHAVVNCDFCNALYQFDKVDLQQMLSGNIPEKREDKPLH